MQQQVKTLDSFERLNFGLSQALSKTELKDVFGGNPGLIYEAGKLAGKAAYACWEAANDFAAGFFDGLLGN